MKYKDWLEEWLMYYVRPTTKERTYEKYRRQIEKHIAPRLGNYEMEELSAQVLQKFAVESMNEGLASNTVIGIVSVLKTSIKRAALLGVAEVHSVGAIVCPKAKEKQVESFTVSEQRKIERYVANAENDKLFGIMLCFYTGLRIGELLALTWQDIDLMKGIMTISKSCHDGWDEGRYVKVIDTPKTKSGYRVVPIPKPLIARLKEIKKRAGCEYVVCGRSKYGAQIRSYQRTFELLLKRLNIAHKGFHALRHTFATRALEVGMDVKTLSEILGHGDSTITLRRYAHSMLEHKTEMMNRVGKLLDSDNKKTPRMTRRKTYAE